MIRNALFIVLCATAAAGPAHAGAIEKVPYVEGAKMRLDDCSVVAVVGSFGTGIDIDARDKIRSYSETDTEVSSAREYAWGHEGDTTFCILSNSGYATTIYQNLVAFFPDKPVRGYIQISDGTDTYQVPEPEKDLP